ncbi:hypothetical protein Goklo_020953 [Gossypium klotzschianum]|uniref:Myb/SANT-like domain-containing protein n=2 Tax=Gossypium klotzschianum TaxID=34286 RepID=A0A7J8UTI1_9ROSI|nr:hypothetical protein [Gossypium klotzschianum]
MGFRRRCCVGCLYGTFNVDTGFKADYLIELEKMLEKVLPYGMLKAKPNLESRIRTLKRDWEIVYDMLSGKNNSGFGWDEHRQLVVAEDVILQILMEKEMISMDAKLIFLWMTWIFQLHNCNHLETKVIPHFQRRKKKISDEYCLRIANSRKVRNDHSRKCSKIISNIM